MDIFRKNLDSLQCIFWWPISAAKTCIVCLIDRAAQRVLVSNRMLLGELCDVGTFSGGTQETTEQIRKYLYHFPSVNVSLITSTISEGTSCLGMQPALPEWLKAAETYLETISWQKCCHTLLTTQDHEVKQEKNENILMSSMRKMIFSDGYWIIKLS